MPKYQSRVRAAAKYDAECYEHVTVKVRRGDKAKIKEAANAAGTSVNRYILEAIEQKSGLKLTLDNTLPWLANGQ